MSTITLLPHQQDVLNQTKEQNKVAYYLEKIEQYKNLTTEQKEKHGFR